MGTETDQEIQAEKNMRHLLLPNPVSDAVHNEADEFVRVDLGELLTNSVQLRQVEKSRDRLGFSVF